MDELLLRRLTPEVIGVLVRRGADFASAEDAVQEALVAAWSTWPDDPPRDPKAWLVTAAWRRFLDATRSEIALWDTTVIAEAVDILQAALARDQLGDFQAQAAIAALHADASSYAATDWPQIVGWYDELLRLTDSPVARLNRAVAVGEADGPHAGLAALDAVDPGLPRHAAVAAHLHEKAGDLEAAGRLYAEAARSAPSEREREHLTRQAARLNRQAARPEPRPG